VSTSSGSSAEAKLVTTDEAGGVTGVVDDLDLVDLPQVWSVEEAPLHHVEVVRHLVPLAALEEVVQQALVGLHTSSMV
jgi:hypothetical protein